MGVELGGGLDESFGVDVEVQLGGKEIDMTHGIGENGEKRTDIFSCLLPASEALGSIVVPEVVEPGRRRSAEVAAAAEEGESMGCLVIGQSLVPCADEQWGRGIGSRIARTQLEPFFERVDGGRADDDQAVFPKLSLTDEQGTAVEIDIAEVEM